MKKHLGWALLAVGCADEPCDFSSAPLGTLTAWESDWLAAGGAPSPPEAQTLLAEDGLKLAFVDWIPADWAPDGPVAVLVPGSSSHSEAYAQLGATMSEAGVYTRIIDVRGHGRSVCESMHLCEDPLQAPRAPTDDGVYYIGRVGDSADAEQIARDLGTHLSDLSHRFPAASMHLVGHSSGGGVVSRYVENASAHGLASVSLLAPYNHPDQPQVRPEVQLACEGLGGTEYARLDMGALGDALRGNDHRYVLSFHKGESYTDALDTLAYTWTTVQGMAARNPDDFWQAHTAPLLFVAAAQDHLLDPDESAVQAERAAGPLEFWLVPDTSHVGLAWSAEVGSRVAEHILAHPTI
jgi:alpha-beta hydrolase superfamily lysophospholipase